jgi:Flp pilus assembly protein TadD
MPDGSVPDGAIPFRITTQSGGDDYRFTSLNGSTYVKAPTGARETYTLIFESDRQRYGTTIFTVDAGDEADRVNIFLAAIGKKKVRPTGAPVVSVHKLKRPSEAACEAHRNGIRAFQNGNSRIAILEMEKAIDAEPEYVDALNDFGVMLLKMNLLDQAADVLSRAVQCGGPVLATVNLGIVWTRQGKYGQAIELLQRFNADNPSDPYGLSALAESLIMAERLREAEGCLQGVLRLNPGGIVEGQAHRKYALLLARRGEFRQALKEISKAVRLLPDDPQVHSELSVIADKTGNKSLGEKERALALRLSPLNRNN